MNIQILIACSVIECDRSLSVAIVVFEVIEAYVFVAYVEVVECGVVIVVIIDSEVRLGVEQVEIAYRTCSVCWFARNIDSVEVFHKCCV